MPLNIRRLIESDVNEYRALRLEGLKNHPDCFGTTYAEATNESIDFFKDQLFRHVVIGGFQSNILHGLACYAPNHSIKKRHISTLYGMYVTNQMRGTGLAIKLVETIINHAKTEVEILQLSVVKSNNKAIKLYEKCGFLSYGTEAKALKIENQYFDEVLMYKDL